MNDLIHLIVLNVFFIASITAYVAATRLVFKIFDWSWVKILIVVGWLLSSAIFLSVFEVATH